MCFVRLRGTQKCTLAKRVEGGRPGCTFDSVEPKPEICALPSPPAKRCVHLRTPPCIREGGSDSEFWENRYFLLWWCRWKSFQKLHFKYMKSQFWGHPRAIAISPHRPFWLLDMFVNAGLVVVLRKTKHGVSLFFDLRVPVFLRALRLSEKPKRKTVVPFWREDTSNLRCHKGHRRCVCLSRCFCDSPLFGVCIPWVYKKYVQIQLHA